MSENNSEAQWDGRDRRAPDPTPWHLDKSLNLGHLLTTLTMVASLFIWGAKMDTRVSILETERVQQLRTNETHEMADRELRQAIKEGIAEVNAKLDKLLFERGRR